jgi:hypothetical protein
VRAEILAKMVALGGAVLCARVLRSPLTQSARALPPPRLLPQATTAAAPKEAVNPEAKAAWQRLVLDIKENGKLSPSRRRLARRAFPRRRGDREASRHAARQ